MDLSLLVQQCTPPNVAPQTMHAIMHVESDHRPHAIGYKIIRRQDGKVFVLNAQPRTQQQAVAWGRWLMAKGFDFDAGAAQVHSTNFKKYGLSLEGAFDACQSIRAGAIILTDCYARALPRYRNAQTALRAALSCYQSGNFSTGFATGYVQKVVSVATK
jgi:type IV secretion system protein VirB1